MKSLSVIQTLSKIGKIFSNIINVCCVVGIVGCICGLISVPFADKGIFKIGGTSVYGLIFAGEKIDSYQVYTVLAGVLIFCIGEYIVSRFSKRYFKNELEAGTPFTLDGANELMRLGIITICVPIGAIVLSEIVCAVITNIAGFGEAIDFDGYDSVAIGVMFIFMSVICRCGAEALNEKANEAEQGS